MSPKQLRSIGIILGLVTVLITILYLVRTWESGDTNWYFLVMACGMMLLLFYSIGKPGRKRKPKL